MAWLTAPPLVAAPNEPQGQATLIDEILPDDTLVMTAEVLAAPSFTQLRNVTSSTTI